MITSALRRLAGVVSLLALALAGCATSPAPTAPTAARAHPLAAHPLAAHRGKPSPRPRPRGPVAQPDACVSTAVCGDGITADPPSGAGLCPDSLALFNGFEGCACSPVGVCAGVCAASCSGGVVAPPFSADCITCLQDTEVGCGGALNACNANEP